MGPAPVVEPAPYIPKQAASKSLKPPAPASPIFVSDEDDATTTAVVVTAVASRAVAARHKVKTTVLALAREIRRPRAYVDYSAFILAGLRMKC